MVRRAFAGVMGATAILVLAGCQPVFVPEDPTRADVRVEVGPEGDAAVRLLLAPQHEDDLSDIAGDVGQAMFPTAETDPHVDGNNGGHPFATIHVDDAYEPGTSPQLRFSATGLRDALAQRGVSLVGLRVCGPRVPLRISSDVAPTDRGRCYRWLLDPDAPAPTVTLAMQPSPARWFSAIGLAAVATGGASVAAVLMITGRTRRHRRPQLGAAAISLIAALGGVATAAAVQGDNLGAAGHLHGAFLFAATLAPIVVLPAAMVSLAALASALGPGSRPLPEPF
jgi:hypothetical protein